MNKRQEQKLATRKKLVEAAREAYMNEGFLGATTAQIAKSCGVAHGTLFVHFPTSDLLMMEVLDAEMAQLSDELARAVAETDDTLELLARYLDFLATHEPFFAVLARETPFYQPELRRKVLFRQSAVQAYFHRALSDDMTEGRLPQCDANLIVQTVFGQLQYYLSMRDVFVDEGSVVERFRDRILSLARTLMHHCGKGGDHA